MGIVFLLLLLAQFEPEPRFGVSEPDVSLHAWLLQADISRDADAKGVLNSA